MAYNRVLLLFCIVNLLGARATAFYTTGDAVVTLEPSTFDEKIADGIWLVEFFAPWCGHCKNLIPEWKKTAEALKGVIHVGAVDADEHKSLGSEFSVKGFPTLKLITVGKSGKRKVMEYKGQRTAKDIVDWALGQAKKIALSKLGGAPGAERASAGGGGSASGSASGGFYGEGSDVVTLTDSNFNEVTSSDDLWLVEFYAPWCGHCKNLKPEYEQLASEVKGKVKIGAVDCTANAATCQQYGVQGYPTIKYFNDKDQPSEYQGGRDAASMATFVLDDWRKSQPSPEAKQLVDQYSLETECTGNDDSPAKKLCVIAFLPHILDSGAAGRKAYIQVLQRLAEKYNDRPFSYSWLEGGAQPALEKNFEVGGYGFPAVVALNPKDGKFAALRDSLSFEHAVEFIERLRQGFEWVLPISGPLADVVSTVPWDGSEGTPVEEDEFSLEDLMKEEL